ncbi:amino acid adenylation domain-containing protein [Chitinimonas sp. PSY-7]|uniref:amino acid adenylation domain-containing protein n=1 Tax=Chitinimonas sp. PSY-7 TaxID=3459088 RepID=UPI00403FDC5C
MSGDAIRLLAELNNIGITVWAEDGQLRFRSPKGRLTDALKVELTQHRAALLALLGEAGKTDTAIERRPGPADVPAPLSIQQRAVWMAEQQGGGAAYLIPGALRIRGPLQADALRDALQTMVNRHEAFRTAIRLVDDEPMQFVLPSVHFDMPRLDWTGLTNIERTSELVQLLDNEARQLFDLTHAPLLRACLVAMAANEHVLLLTPHHIVADGWSIDIMVRELSESYRPEGGIDTSAGVNPPLGYADFAVWQEGRSARGEDSADLDYWRNTLTHLPPPLELPTKQAVVHDGAFAGASLQATLPVATSQGLRHIAAQAGTTLFSALTALFATLLYRYTGQSDVVMGTANAGRGRVELEEVVGLFAGRLPLRLDLSGEPSFQELIGRVARSTASALSHAEVPAERILATAVAVDSRESLFQVMIALQNAVRSSLRFAGLEVEMLPIASNTAKFELFLAIDEAGDALTLGLEYATARFDAPRMQALLDHLLRLAKAVVATPDLPITRLAMLLPAERAALLATQPDVHIEPAETLPQRVRRIALTDPDRPAMLSPLRWGDAQTVSCSYGQLWQRAETIAAALQRSGLRQGDVVAVVGDRSMAFVEAMLAVLVAGGTYMPLAPDLPEARIAEMLEDSGASIMLACDTASAALSAYFTSIIDLTTLVTEETSQLRAVQTAAEQAAYVIFTSGSTGRPKGVQISHANVLHFVAGLPLCHKEGQPVFLHFAPSSFDASVMEIWGALLTGAQLVIAPPGLPGFDALADLMETYAVNVSVLTVGVFVQLSKARPQTLAGLDILMSGGDRMPVAAARNVLVQGGRARLYNVYGPTEATVFSAVHLVESQDVADGVGAIPIGPPYGSSRLYVLDAHRELVPAGVIGELYIGGGNVGLGYINRPDLTEERFLPDPFTATSEARMYRTGDLVRWRDDGVLEFLGRADRQVKIRGFRIELGEIEAHLGMHPAAAQAAVDARESPNGLRLVAYIVPKQGIESIDTADMQAFLAARLPKYMVPTALVCLDALPLTRNGKLDRNALPAPDYAEATACTLPEGEPAQILARIWQAVLQQDQVVMEDNFYTLGGDSIMAMQVSMRLARQGWSLRPQDMLKHPTLQAQSGLMQRQTTSVVRRASDVPQPITPIQSWFFSLGLANPHHWNQAVRLAVNPSSLPRLGQAVAALEAAHDALRLRFLLTDQGWRLQAVSPNDAPLRHCSAVNEEEALACIEAAQRSLNIATGPVWCALLIEGPHDDWPHLVLIAHHLVVDGVSWRVLIEDLTLAVAGNPIPPATLSFADWAGHQASEAQAPISIAADPVWPPIADPDGSNLESQTQLVTLSLSGSDTIALLGSANLAYRSEPTELLLAAVMLGLQRAIGQSRLTVALERHGREVEGVDLSGTVGWFTAITPVLLEVIASPDMGTAVLAIKQAVRSAPRLMTQQVGEGPAVAFNYLGRFDNVVPADGPFRPVTAGCGNSTDPEGKRPYPLEIVAVVESNVLRIDFRFSEDQIKPATVNAWVAATRHALHELLIHLSTLGVAGRAPCDFPLAGIHRQPELDALLREHGLKASEVADLLPVTPQQRGMLLESMAYPGSGMHIEQFVATFNGAFDREALMQTWSRLITRHEALRSGFLWRQDNEPLCVVFEQANPVWQHLDWRTQANQNTAHWLERDRLAGFDGIRPPLRFATIQLSDEHWLFVWTYHHALLDGWSVAHLLNEAMSPNGSGTSPTHARDHVRWLMARDREAAESFWHKALADAPVPTTAGQRDENLPQGHGYADLRTRVPANVVQQLTQLAHRWQMTPAALAQGLWGMAIAWATRRHDVVFARTVSGRPAEIVGSENWVGLFINSLPLRLKLPSTGSAWSWLAEASLQAAAQSPFEWCAGGDIHSWSGLPPSQPLCDSLLIFENYPNTPQSGEGSTASIVAVAGHGARTHFPVTLLIVLDDGWRCELVCNEAYMPAGEGQHLLDAFAQLAAAVVDEGIDIAKALADLPAQTPRLCRLPERQRVLPRSPLELELVQMWQALLATPEVSIHDDFFALGGHSLLVLDLMNRLRTRFTRSLPFTAFLRHPTVAGLATLLEGKAKHTAVSLLQLGEDGAPLYLVPGASGNPMAYQALARSLSGRFALVGAQPEHDPAQPASIEAMAAELANAIGLQQPEGSLYLTGHSFGAIVAFEAACKLSKAGRHVAALVLIDTAVPDGGKAFADYDESDWIVAIAEAAGSYFAQPVLIERTELVELESAARRQLMLERLQAAGALAASASIEVIDSLLLSYRHSVAALANYRPGHWPGTLSVIHADTTPQPADPSLGWIAHCARIGTTLATSGDHITMVTEPHAPMLADRLAEAIAACQSIRSA